MTYLCFMLQLMQKMSELYKYAPPGMMNPGMMNAVMNSGELINNVLPLLTCRKSRGGNK